MLPGEFEEDGPNARELYELRDSRDAWMRAAVENERKVKQLCEAIDRLHIMAHDGKFMVGDLTREQIDAAADLVARIRKE